MKNLCILLVLEVKAQLADYYDLENGALVRAKTI